MLNNPDKKLIFVTKDDRNVFCLASQVVGFRQESSEYVVFLESGDSFKCKAKEEYYRELSDILDAKCNKESNMSMFEEMMLESALIKLNDKKDIDLGSIICNLFVNECVICPMKTMCRKNNSKETVNAWLRKDA